MEYKFKEKITTDQNSLGWNSFIVVPNQITEKLIDKKSKRVVCTLNNKLTIQAALMPSKEGFHYILINKENRKKLGTKDHEVLEVKLKKDESEYGIATPHFFKEFCEQDPEGSKLFHELKPGAQRTLLHLMTKPKSENKQLEKTWVIFDYLKNSNGNLDFKELMLAFKDNRFKKI